MFTKYRKSLIASGVALALAGGAFAGTPSHEGISSKEVTEARQETQIWTTYALSPYLRANNLQVSVDGDKATLTGKVDESVNKQLAEQIALGVSGVKQVDNQIVVQADYSPPAQQGSDRSFGELVDDASITSAIKSKLMWSKDTGGLTTKVDTKRGQVTLVGTADSAAARDLAGRLASNTHGVTSVDNQLMVNKDRPVARDSKSGAAMDVADGWITTKVKSTLMYSDNVDGSDIAVSTNAGVVTLTGNVESGAERCSGHRARAERPRRQERAVEGTYDDVRLLDGRCKLSIPFTGPPGAS